MKHAVNYPRKFYIKDKHHGYKMKYLLLLEFLELMVETLAWR